MPRSSYRDGVSGIHDTMQRQSARLLADMGYVNAPLGMRRDFDALRARIARPLVDPADVHRRRHDLDTYAAMLEGVPLARSLSCRRWVARLVIVSALVAAVGGLASSFGDEPRVASKPAPSAALPIPYQVVEGLTGCAAVCAGYVPINGLFACPCPGEPVTSAADLVVSPQ